MKIEKKSIHIGLITQNGVIANWVYQAILKLTESKTSKIILIINLNLSNISNFNSPIFHLYSKLDKKYFKRDPDALKEINIVDIAGVIIINTEPKFNKNNIFIDSNVVKSIKDFNIDLIFQVNFNIFEGGILNIAKYGIWSFNFGDNLDNNYNYRDFLEVLRRKGVIKMSLLSQLKCEFKIIATSYSLTDNLSISRTQNYYLWKASSILSRKIDELIKYGETEFYSKVKEMYKNSNFIHDTTITKLSNWNLLALIFKFNWQRIIKIVKGRFYFDQWILLFNLEEKANISFALPHFKKMIPPKDRFWADPHVVFRNNKYYIFIEELIYKENKGFISVIEMDDKGNYNSPVKILEKDYHLSFPFIFEDDGELYMIPETKQCKNIQLYRCEDFPLKWKFEAVLMDNVLAVDTAIIKKDNKYWLFTNMVEYEGASLHDELYLFSSDKLISSIWNSHDENPIVSDVKNARSAGKLFKYNNKLYRPSQNCSNHYGYGMQINEVIELSDTKYFEKNIDYINPNWDKNIIATHSLAIVDKLTVIDAQLRRRK